MGAFAGHPNPRELPFHHYPQGSMQVLVCFKNIRICAMPEPLQPMPRHRSPGDPYSHWDTPKDLENRPDQETRLYDGSDTPSYRTTSS